jgi:mannitol-1-phosphate/altronate dehydrogenase
MTEYVWGRDLVQSPRFVEAVAQQLRSLQEFGVKETLA